MTSTLTRYTENMALREQSLEDVWSGDWVLLQSDPRDLPASRVFV